MVGCRAGSEGADEGEPAFAEDGILPDEPMRYMVSIRITRIKMETAAGDGYAAHNWDELRAL
jgi:hypothetical protein